MKRHITTLCFLTIVLVLFGLTVCLAQGLGSNAQRARAGMTSILGARATAMGGAAVAVPEDGTALYWNPAAMASHRNTEIYGSIGGSAEGLDTAEDLGDVVDIIGDATEGGFEALDTDDWLTILDVIERNNGSVVRGSLGAIGSIEMNNFGLGYWIIAGGDAVVNKPNDNQVNWNSAAVGQAGAGVGYGKSISDSVDVGVTARAAIFGIATANGNARDNDPADDVVDATYTNAENDDYDDDLTADLGLIYSPNENVHFGVVGRNLTQPSFDLAAPFGTVELDASFDIGYCYTDEKGGLFAVDVHNATSANDESSQLVVGAAAPLSDTCQFRFGYGDDQPTMGFGLELGGLQLDIASAIDWEDRVAVSGSWCF
jgi:hypothetical protein